MHPMQGDLTPDYLEWLLKWAPTRFENTLGVYLRDLDAGEEAPKDPRDRWLRDTVVRTVNQPVEGTNGGQYLSTKFTVENQIIARRASHLTYTKKEIYREKRGSGWGDGAGDPPAVPQRVRPRHLGADGKAGEDQGPVQAPRCGVGGLGVLMFRLLKVTETRGGKKTVTEHAKPQPIQHHAPGSSIKRTRHIGQRT